MQPLSENQRPDLLTSPDISALQMSHACHPFWKCMEMLQSPHVLFFSRLTRCTIPCACHAKRHLNVQKWSEHVVFLNILTSKCASRHKGVNFFDMSTSKSAPSPSVFNTFDFEMCFAPQWRTLFRHLNFQKWSVNGVVFTF